MRSLKLKFTVVFSATLAVVVIVLSVLIYYLGVARRGPQISGRELEMMARHYPSAHMIVEREDQLEELAEVGSMVRDDQQEEFTKLLLQVTGLLIASSTVVAYVLSSYLVKPIENLAYNVSTISRLGGEQLLPKEKSSEEIEVLVDEFNRLLSDLEKAFDAQEQFIQDAAHELRTPMAAMKANLQVLRKKKDVSKKDYESTLSVVEDLNEKLIKLNENLLLLNRDQEETRHFEKADLVALVEDVVDSLTVIARENNVSISIDSPKRISVPMNSQRLAMAIQNIVENAIKYSKPGKSGEILISIKKKKQSVVISVEDNGIGIAEKDKSRIFDRFYRGSGTEDMLVDGSGLGLSVVKKIIDEHRGTIEVDSTKGKGTTVTIEIPRK